MADTHTLLYALSSVSGLVIIWRYFGLPVAQQYVHRPPSPRSLPLLGNLFSIPSGLEHEAYMKLGKQLNSKRAHCNV